MDRKNRPIKCIVLLRIIGRVEDQVLIKNKQVSIIWIVLSIQIIVIRKSYLQVLLGIIRVKIIQDKDRTIKDLITNLLIWELLNKKWRTMNPYNLDPNTVKLTITLLINSKISSASNKNLIRHFRQVICLIVIVMILLTKQWILWIHQKFQTNNLK